MRARLRNACFPAALALAGGCAGGRSFPEAAPVALLPSTPASAAAFEALRSAWAEPGRTSPAALRRMLEAFLMRFPDDEVTPVVRVALALVAMDLGDTARADAELAATARLPPGPARDLRTIAAAKRRRLAGDPERALALLRPLVGKNVDPLARATFEEELALAAVETHRDYEVLSYLDAWLRASGDDEKPAAIARAQAIIGRLPREVLINAFQTMHARRTSYGYGADIDRILALRLVQIAIEAGDPKLARLLLDSSPEAVAIAGEAGRELGELANSRRGMNVVDGRTVGVLLPTDSPELRDESADVLRGAMWSLGLAHATRPAPARPGPEPARAAADATGPTSLRPCAALEDAPDPGPALPDEGVRLVTRNDAGSAARTELSLDELAGEGASVVIAGLDPQTAGRALHWGEQHGVAVIALVAPDPSMDAPPPNATAPGRRPAEIHGGALDPAAPHVARSYGFVLGEPSATVIGALARGVPKLAAGTVTPFVDASEMSFWPRGGGAFAGLTFAPPFSCDAPILRAGESRFAGAPWVKDREALALVSGSPACANDLVHDLASARVRATVALTLEAATLMAAPRLPSLRVLTAHAGVVPAAAADDPRTPEVRRFADALGDVEWWAALGRDASELARLAVRTLPADEVNDPERVSSRRTQARDELARARARLWTTESAHWASDHTMPRTVCVMDATTR